MPTRQRVRETSDGEGGQFRMQNNSHASSVLVSLRGHILKINEK